MGFSTINTISFGVPPFICGTLHMAMSENVYPIRWPFNSRENGLELGVPYFPKNSHWDSAMGQFFRRIPPMVDSPPNENQAKPGIFKGLFQGFLSRQSTVHQSLRQEFQVLLWPQPGSIDLIQGIPGLTWVLIQP